jgi:uncharacterized protein (TIGR03435 family)
MKKAPPFAAALLVALTGTLHAQTVIGTWQGTLPITENPRIVLNISKTDEGALRGVFYRIDQYPDSLPLSSVSFQTPDLSVVSAIQDTSYRGKLSADGKSITGTWIQNKQSYPLTFVAAAPDTLWTYGNSVALAPMSLTADPAFEVATIKPSPPGAGGRSGSAHTHQCSQKNATVDDLLRLAYQVRDRQIEGAPAWMNETKFDIEAVADVPGSPNDDQVRVMIRKLLADRFQLSFHKVQKTFSVYALTVEKDPPKLVKSDPAVNRFAHIMTKPQPDGQMLVQFLYDRMPEFADILMNFIPDRQIVDETGLRGPYDFTPTVPMSALQSTDDNEKAIAFIEALKPLGFKLVPKKAPIEVIVIDHLEKPSAN